MSRKKIEKDTAIGTTGGVVVGAWLGSSVGIAALGTAISGVIPLALVGGYAGYRIAKHLRNKLVSTESVKPTDNNAMEGTMFAAAKPTLTPEETLGLYEGMFEKQKEDMLSAGLTTMGPERQTYKTRNYLVECSPGAVLVIIRKHDGFAIVFEGSDACGVLDAVKHFGGGTDELDHCIHVRWSASMTDNWHLVPIDTLHFLDPKVVRQLKQKSKATFDYMCDTKEDGTMPKDTWADAGTVAEYALTFYAACTAALARNPEEPR